MYANLVKSDECLRRYSITAKSVLIVVTYTFVKKKNIMFKLLTLMMIFGIAVKGYNDEDYVDAVINMLLNGESKEFTQSVEVDEGKFRFYISIWNFER